MSPCQARDRSSGRSDRASGRITAGVLAGAAIGFANGAIYTGLKVPSFLVTLGTMSVCAGVAGHLSGGSAIVYSSTALPEFVNSKSLLGIPNVIFIVLAVAALLTAVSFRTKFGRYLYAIGGGEPVAVLSGINLRRYKILAFVLGGALCGLGGVILTGQVQAGSPSAGDALLLDSIAAVVMGGTASREDWGEHIGRFWASSSSPCCRTVWTSPA